MTHVIPDRFGGALDQHLVFNFAGVAAWPLVLGVFGRPGDGKSFQIRTHLERRGVSSVTVNAADLESDRAGAPGKLVLDLYVDAGHRLDESEPAALVIDDFDTTVGEWSNSTTTVNHQQVLAQLMHLADNPTQAGEKRLRRVPIFITGNDLSKIYPPLRRPGRMRAFPWLPTDSERAQIVTAILEGVLDSDGVAELLATLPDAPVAFFSDLRVEVLSKIGQAEVRKHVGQLQALIRPSSRARQELEGSLTNLRLPAQELVDTAVTLWRDRQIAIQSHLGE